jgi:hypothetical protein
VEPHSSAPNGFHPLFSRCDRRVGTCLYDRVQQERLFLQCLIETSSASFRDTLTRYAGWDFTLPVDEHVDALLEQYQEDFCVARNSNWSPLRNHFHRPPLDVCPAGCTSAGNILCLDNACPIPLWCEDWTPLRPGAICASSWTILRFPSAVCGVADAFCNWSPGLTADECLARTESYCAMCMGDGDTVCGMLPEITDEATCERTVACMLADGRVVTDLTASQCKQEFTCSKLCPGGEPCTSQQACEQQGGECHDPSAILGLMRASVIVDPAQLTGYCLFEHVPFNSPACGAENVYNAGLDIGCVKYASCGAVSQGCTWINRTPQECAANGGTWVYALGIPQNECELSGCTDYSLNLLTPKSASQCSDCGGSRKRSRVWKAGRWSAGVVGPTTWMAPAYSSPYALAPSLNMAILNENVRQAANYEFDFLLQTELSCSINPTRDVIYGVTCSCLDDGGGKCFTASSPLVAIGRMCVGNDVLNGVHTLSVSVGENADTFVDADECAEFEISLVNSLLFDPAPAPDITTGRLVVCFCWCLGFRISFSCCFLL